MNKVVEILMKRDDMTEQEATKEVTSVAEEVEDCIAAGNYDAVADILMNGLGVEEDYIFDILGY